MSVKLCDGKRVMSFEYGYMVVMIVYLSQMIPRMSRMLNGLTGDWFVLLLPIFLTIVLCQRNSVSFSNTQLQKILAITLLWSFLIIIKMRFFSFSRLNDYVFFPYIIIIAYIHCKVFGKYLFSLYEHIMLMFCKISIIFWLVSVLVPVSSVFWHLFPETAVGNNFLLMYNWVDPAKQAAGALRNTGCTWEAGHFACMILVAMAINMSRNGFKLRGNMPLLWFICTIFTTFSTTGYTSMIILISVFYLKSLKHGIVYVLAGLPFIYFLSTLDFMGDKLEDNANVQEGLENVQNNIAWREANGGFDKEGWAVSLGRFQSMYIEATINIPNDPILGYGRNDNESMWSNSTNHRIGTDSGSLKVIAQYGIPLGLYFYYILFLSSRAFAMETNIKRKWGLFLGLFLPAISYSVFCWPVWMSMWFYGIFKPNEHYWPKFIK